jgi:hypothetical protein
MSKKKTPQEKKEAQYTRDHYSSPWHSPRGFRKSWKKKKNNLNRVLRRKSKGLLHSVEGRSVEELGPEEESLTSKLFEKGLLRKRIKKIGVVTIGEKVKIKKEKREFAVGRKKLSEAGRAAGFRRFLTKILEEKNHSERELVQVSQLTQSWHFLNFLNDEPIWTPKLQQWILSTEKRLAWKAEK